ncbi:MAG TPA: endonuclease III [Steroidobacteraceae bacterium]|nr:endonuclease III [Steroidobacteraceae bacterium]
MPASRRAGKRRATRGAERGPARLDAASVRLLYERLRAAIPAPRSELVYRTPYQLLVSVILSAQATDRSVNLATGPLFAVAGTPEAIVGLGVRGLARYIRTIGLWRMKAKNVVAASRLILAHHGGEVPREREALEALPGVGRKTANVVMNTAFGEPTIAVDTHIFRVSNRTGLAPGRNVREVEDRLVAVTPAEFAQDAHHWLILHGRYTCIARKPRCPRCPIRDLCRWPHKTAEKAAISSG